MIEKLKQYKTKNNIVFLPNTELNLKESITYNFKNVIILDKEKEDNEIINILNNSNIKKIYLIGYNGIYNYILPRLKKEMEVCWIFNHSFSSLSNYNKRENLHYIFEYYDRNLVKSIGCINKENYEALKNAGYNCELIELKYKKEQTKLINFNTIGLLSNDYDPNNNFYNQLAALTFVDYDYCKLTYTMQSTKEFIKKFQIKYKKENNINNIIVNNFVNLYINFTNTNNELIHKSFNYGVPCILGNTNIFDNNKYLKDHLVLKSDDDINEIVEKINFVKENRDKILKEAQKVFN